MGNAVSLAVAIGVPLVGGAIGGFASQAEIPVWYANLKKPRWTPPNWLFGPAWSILYITQGVASWLVYQKKGPGRRVPLVLYGIQLALNLVWNPLFFKTHKTDVALADITALLGVATAATVAMSKATSPKVQLPLMGPYLAWVSYATALTFAIWKDNPSERLVLKGDPSTKAKRKHDVKTASKEAQVAIKDGAKAAVLAGEAVAAGLAASKHLDSAKAAWAAPAEPPPHDPVRDIAANVQEKVDDVVGAVKTGRAAVATASAVTSAAGQASANVKAAVGGVASKAQDVADSAGKMLAGPPAAASESGTIVSSVAELIHSNSKTSLT